MAMYLGRARIDKVRRELGAYNQREEDGARLLIISKAIVDNKGHWRE